MNGKPWADHRATLDKRLIAAELAIANVDTAAERRAIMSELVAGARRAALEEAVRIVVMGADRGPEWVLATLRDLQARAPAR